MATLRCTTQLLLAVNRTMYIRKFQDCRQMRGQTRVESVWLPTRKPITRLIWRERITGCLTSEGAYLDPAGQLTAEQLCFKEEW